MEGTTLGPKNLTEVQTYTVEYVTYIVSLCVMIVIFVTGVIGNGLVIFVTGYKMKTTVNSIWFLNLAITDLIFIPILFSLIASFFHMLEISNLMYNLGNIIFVLNMYASVFLLTVISLDRCLCTWCVVWAQNKRTLVKARIICVFVWLLAICCSLLFGIFNFKPKDTLQYKQIDNDTLQYEQIVHDFKFQSLCMFMVGFLIPFLIITSSYIAIGVRVRRLPRGNHFWIFRVIFVILTLFISWFPFHFVQFFFAWAPYNDWNMKVFDILQRASVFILCLVFLSGSLNPILYVFMCDEYKKKLKMSLLLVFEGAFTEDHLGLH